MPVANLSRRTLTLALAFAPTGLRGGTEPCPPLPKVLFVCPAGSVKSAIARETLKSRAARLGIRVQIQSRGLVPEDHVSPALAAKLTADGIKPGADALRALSSAEVAAATTMPILLLGGDPGDQLPQVVDGWERAMREPNVRGLIPGRALLYPHDGDIEGIVATAARIVHGPSSNGGSR